MRVTPLDIIQKQFSPARRAGYEPEEVRQFLEQVRESMEDLLKESQRLREQLTRRESEIDELRSKESDVKHTLMLARRVSDDMERQARRESDVIVGEARLEAEKILLTASDERRELQADIHQAEDDHDIGRLDALQSEFDAIVNELSQGLGLGGRVGPRHRVGGIGQPPRIAHARRSLRSHVRRVPLAWASAWEASSCSLRCCTVCSWSYCNRAASSRSA